MNWGHRFKELFTRNWREKLISLLLAFLFWYMIKAQDARSTQPYPTRPTPAAPSPPAARL
jgi:YbbR domain-containing protein